MTTLYWLHLFEYDNNSFNDRNFDDSVCVFGDTDEAYQSLLNECIKLKKESMLVNDK